MQITHVLSSELEVQGMLSPSRLDAFYVPGTDLMFAYTGCVAILSFTLLSALDVLPTPPPLQADSSTSQVEHIQHIRSVVHEYQTDTGSEYNRPQVERKT